MFSSVQSALLISHYESGLTGPSNKLSVSVSTKADFGVGGEIGLFYSYPSSLCCV